ncbi:hypothetical protein ANAPC5_01512 [Anaplasma phagocytophilum]|nr:hypothetical protein ANAPC5_01512 [Anaplasma phagocytophilum]
MMHKAYLYFHIFYSGGAFLLSLFLKAFHNCFCFPLAWSCATSTEGKGKMDVLRAKLRHLRKHNKRLQQRPQRRRQMLTVTEIVESVRSIVYPTIAALVKAQLKMSHASRFGRWWCSQNKAFALGLYFHSPKGYRYCRQLLRLPSVIGRYSFDFGVFP